MRENDRKTDTLDFETEYSAIQNNDKIYHRDKIFCVNAYIKHEGCYELHNKMYEFI